MHADTCKLKHSNCICVIVSFAYAWEVQIAAKNCFEGLIIVSCYNSVRFSKRWSVNHNIICTRTVYNREHFTPAAKKI